MFLKEILDLEINLGMYLLRSRVVHLINSEG